MKTTINRWALAALLVAIGWGWSAIAQTRIAQGQMRHDQPVIGSVLATNSGGPTRINLVAGTPPTTTADIDPVSGQQMNYDAVLYVDVADGKLKTLLRNGSVVTLTP